MARLSIDGVRSVRRRTSLRIGIFAAVTVAALAPLLAVFVWSQFERNIPGKIWRETLLTVEAAEHLPSIGDLEVSESAIRRLADERAARIRIVDARGAVLVDVDADAPKEREEWLETFFFGDQERRDASQIDDELGPVGEREEFAIARAQGTFIGCRTSHAVVCQGIREIPRANGEAAFLHVQKTSLRAVQAVYAFRHQLARLALMTVPVALLLALYLTSRLMRPIESIRRQALAKAQAASRSADLEVHRDEVGDLAAAFNTLLASLDERRAANEAFVADLVHELKTPLAAVRATAEALDAGPVSSERASKLAHVLSSSAKNLDALVSQFLELARAEAGMPNEERSLVDVAALTRGLVQSARNDARYAETELVCHADEPALVWGVAHRIESILREVVENAASFAERKSDETDAQRVTIDVVKTSTSVRVTIHDDGPGILEEDLPKVFDRFFTTRSRSRGTGLGLSIVRAVLEAHGGSAKALSSPGEGATIELTWPLASASQGATRG